MSTSHEINFNIDNPEEKLKVVEEMLSTLKQHYDLFEPELEKPSSLSGKFRLFIDKLRQSKGLPEPDYSNVSLEQLHELKAEALEEISANIDQLELQEIALGFAVSGVESMTVSIP